MSKYRPEIDGLRTLAVLPVILFHYHIFPNSVSGGFLGVDVFFVISGFLIVGIISSSCENEKFSFTEFYKRRAKRLLPAAAIVFLTSWIAGYLILYKEEFRLLSADMLHAIFFTQNINLALNVGYFGQEAEVRPLLHTWSLAVEEQFYLLAPLMVFFAHRLGGMRAVRGVLAVTLVLSFCSIFLVRNPEFRFYLLHTRAWELAAGGLLAVFVGHPALRLGRGPRLIAALLGLFLIFLGYGVVSEQSRHPGLITILPVLGTLLILAFVRSDGLVGRVLGSGPMVSIGRISYEIYLWHFPLFAFALIYYGAIDEFPIGTRLTLVLASVNLAYLTNRFVANPIRFGISGRRLAAAMGLVVGVPLVAAGTTFLKTDVPGSFADQQSELSELLEGPLWALAQNDLCMDGYAPAEAQSWGWFFCYQTKPSTPEVVLLGNSYANQWLPLVMEAPALSKYSVLSFGACPIARHYRDGGAVEGNRPCTGDRAAVQADVIDRRILGSGHVKWVFLEISGAGPGYLARRVGEVRDRVGPEVPIVLIYPHAMPAPREIDTASCVARPLVEDLPEKCSMRIADITRLYSAERKAQMAAAVASLPNVYFFDPNKAYCDAVECQFVVDGFPVFRDAYQHASRHLNRLVQPYFDGFLEGIGDAPGIADAGASPAREG